MMLISSDTVQGGVYEWFTGNQEQKTQKHSMIEAIDGDREIGEIIYHPNMIDVIRNEDVNDYKNEIEETQKNDNTPSGPPTRLKLNKEYTDDLMQNSMKLNDDFLKQSQFQFAEYLGLTMIQLIFDRNLESKDFLEIFESDDNYQPALDTKLIQAQSIVEKKVKEFGKMHSKAQTDNTKKIVNKYVGDLKKKADQNGGFPDTESMKTALFGQVAFLYEQQCQDIYKNTSKEFIKQTKEEVTKLLDKIEREASPSDKRVQNAAAVAQGDNKNLFLY